MGSLIVSIENSKIETELLEYLRKKGLDPRIVEDDILEDLALVNAIETGEMKETVDTGSFIDLLINEPKSQ